MNAMQTLCGVELSTKLELLGLTVAHLKMHQSSFYHYLDDDHINKDEDHYLDADHINKDDDHDDINIHHDDNDEHNG